MHDFDDFIRVLNRYETSKLEIGFSAEDFKCENSFSVKTMTDITLYTKCRSFKVFTNNQVKA